MMKSVFQVFLASILLAVLMRKLKFSRLCNTMSVDVDEGVEFFNTVVLQPHRKLVTNQGRGYHVRCRYQTEEKTLLSTFDVE